MTLKLFDSMSRELRDYLIGLMLGPDAPADLATRLMRHEVFVSVRGPSARVSPHLYNTEEDIDRFFNVLDQVVG